MAWKDVAAELGTKVLVGEFKAVEPLMSKGQYKRLLSTAVAQLLALHPDVKARKARRWARKATGVKPSRKALKAAGSLGAKEAVEAAVVTAAGVGAAKLGRKLAPRLSQVANRAVERGKKAVGASDNEENRRGR